MERAAERQATAHADDDTRQPDLALEPEAAEPTPGAPPQQADPEKPAADGAKKQQTAIAKVEAATESKSLTVGQQKAFLELAGRSDLDKLSPEQQRGFLIAFGRQTGLRPELGEVMLYQGRPYITIAGRLRNAHKNGLLDGIKPFPVTPSEKTNAGYEPTDIVWKVQVYRRGSAFPFTGWGKVTRAEIEKARKGEKSKFTPIANHPVEIARKRAEYDGLRLAFPIDEELNDMAARFIQEAEEEAAAYARRGASVRTEASELEDELAGRTEVPIAALGAGAAPETASQQ